MPQSALEMAQDLTLALVKAKQLSPEDARQTLEQTHATVLSLQAQPAAKPTDPAPVPKAPSGDWQKTITKRTVTCLDCGASFKQLSIRHLRHHGLDMRSYRAKHGIPQSQSLSARDITARRRQMIQETRLWEKAPTFLKSQTRAATALRKALLEVESQAPIEAAQAPAPASPVRPRRQRKSARKTSARKQGAQA